MIIDKFNQLTNDEKLALTDIYVEGNPQPIDLSYCNNLLDLGIFELFGFDLKHCPLLERLVINSEIVSINLSFCVNLCKVCIEKTWIESIDFSCNSNLILIDMSYNMLKTIILPPNVKTLHLDHNRFTQIDISCPKLEELYIDNNPLHTINIISCPSLIDFTAENTLLSSIDLRNCLNLANVLITGTHIFKHMLNGKYYDDVDGTYYDDAVDIDEMVNLN